MSSRRPDFWSSALCGLSWRHKLEFLSARRTDAVARGADSLGWRTFTGACCAKHHADIFMTVTSFIPSKPVTQRHFLLMPPRWQSWCAARLRKPPTEKHLLGG